MPDRPATPGEPGRAQHFCGTSAFAHEPRDGCSEFATPVDPPGYDPMTMSWFAQPDDLIGGWCVMLTDEPPSVGGIQVADFCHERVARHVAELHNGWLESHHTHSSDLDADTCEICFPEPSLADRTDLQGHLIDPPLLAQPSTLNPRRSSRKPVRGKLGGADLDTVPPETSPT
jgi:hypothetical protein